VNEKKPTSTGLSASLTTGGEGRFKVGRSAELLVAARLVDLGFDVFFPFSDRSPVDLIGVWEGHPQRIQVKARWQPRVGAGQDVTASGVNSSNADALVVYLNNPTPSFYIIPAKEINEVSTVMFYPAGRSGKTPRRYWDEWRDRWDILKCSPKCT
tara:strand:+ start:473 stop:937 length:465 start_codon:yes stop_codon:yes gene_type:complete